MPDYIKDSLQEWPHEGADRGNDLTADEVVLVFDDAAILFKMPTRRGCMASCIRRCRLVWWFMIFNMRQWERRRDAEFYE